LNNILLTFTGFHDPFTPGLVKDEEQTGPILSLLAEMDFGTVYLFETPTTHEITEETRNAILERHESTGVEIHAVNLDEPTDYRGIIRGLRNFIPTIRSTHSEDRLFVAVASGTPQMHACWLMLVGAGELPAKILHVRPPRFVTRERPLVSEIDLSSDEFPTVRYLRTDTDDALKNQDLATLQQRVGIIGEHESMILVLEQAMQFAQTDASVLIYGQSGTGKELLAKLIHLGSQRSDQVFIAINCGAIPESLVESLLFGHIKGSFTGATVDRKGKFEEADGGTLFLDEIGELPLSTQVKLLRVLQEGTIEPVGGGGERNVDVRIIGATNRDLQSMIRKKAFREDLYFRLNIGELTLPPLSDRRSDIPLIAQHVLDSINGNQRTQKRLTVEALQRLQSHNWPGNIRELYNAIHRSVTLSSKVILDADDIIISTPVTHDDPLDSLPNPYHGFSMPDFLDSARKQLFLKAMEIAGGNRSEVGRLLGISPQAVAKFFNQNGDEN